MSIRRIVIPLTLLAVAIGLGDRGASAQTIAAERAAERQAAATERVAAALERIAQRPCP